MSLINDALKRASQAERARNPRPQATGAMQPVKSTERRAFPVVWMAPAAVVLLLGLSSLLLLGWWKGRSPETPGPLAAAPKGAPVSPAPPTATANTPAQISTLVVAPAGQTQTPKPPEPVTPSVPKPTAKPATTAAVASVDLSTQPDVQTTKPPDGPPSVPPANAEIEKPPPGTYPVGTSPNPTLQTTAVPVVASTTPPPPPPPPRPKVQFPELQVQGIFFRPSNPSALINGRTLFVGDRMGEIKVVAIKQESVELEKDGETKTFWLR